MSIVGIVFPLISLVICFVLIAEHALGRRLFPSGRSGTLVVAFPLLFLFLGSAWISMVDLRQTLRVMGANEQAGDLGDLMWRTMFGFFALTYFMSREHRQDAEDREAKARVAAA